jgi:hypothetical protein
MAGEVEKEGAFAGLVTATFASALLIVALVAGVSTIDWTDYAAQVGTQIADEVRAAVVPATVVAALASMAVVYVFCLLAGWLGALLYDRLAGLR